MPMYLRADLTQLCQISAQPQHCAHEGVATMRSTVLAFAAVVAAACAAQNTAQDTAVAAQANAVLCRDLRCVGVGAPCTAASACCTFGSGQRCDTTSQVCTPQGCRDNAGSPVQPVPEGCFCQSSSDCDFPRSEPWSARPTAPEQIRGRCNITTLT